jgi:hypothetical protein
MGMHLEHHVKAVDLRLNLGGEHFVRTFAGESEPLLESYCSRFAPLPPGVISTYKRGARPSISESTHIPSSSIIFREKRENSS